MNLAEHLVASRLAGEVATTRGSTRQNCRKMIEGRPEYTFGLSDYRDATVEEALDAIRALCGGDPEAGAADDPGWIEPDSTLKAIERHRQRLESFAAEGGRVLCATGHPTGLLPHYAAIARALVAHGCEVLAPLDESWIARDWRDRPVGIRFLDGVACVTDGGSLRHSHRSVFMEAMLDALPETPDLVIGDHGMAGAAVECGIATLSIADVNDPALPVAQVRGRTDGVLPIDDNLSPRLFVPVTQAMLGWA